MTRNEKPMMYLRCVDPQTPQHHHQPLLTLSSNKRHETSFAIICPWRCRAATLWPQWLLRCVTLYQMLKKQNPQNVISVMSSLKMCPSLRPWISLKLKWLAWCNKELRQTSLDTNETKVRKQTGVKAYFSNYYKRIHQTCNWYRQIWPLKIDTMSLLMNLTSKYWQWLLPHLDN